MFALRRWWTRYWLRLLLIGLALGGSLAFRESRAALLSEVYRWATLPLYAGAPADDRVEDSRVRELEQRLEDLESRNRQMQTMLEYRATLPNPGVVATAIGRGADNWWQQILVNRGTETGVQVGAIATSPGGLVGRVISTTSHTSRILLASDPTSRIGVAVARSRFMGYLRGRGDRIAIMEFFDKIPDVQPGDAIVTSSYSQLYPMGIPIGRVISVDSRRSPAPQALIELSAPLNSLEWVVLSPNRADAFAQPAPAQPATGQPGTRSSGTAQPESAGTNKTQQPPATNQGRATTNTTAPNPAQSAATP